MRFDLHMHTHFSDGIYSPTDVAIRGKKAGLKGIAVTDHDTVEGATEAAKACHEIGIAFILGIEISTIIEGEEIHMLAFQFDIDDVPMSDMLVSQRASRANRGEEFIRVLRTAGLALPPVDELRIGVEGSLGRPHIAQLIIDAGAASSINEAFRKYLTPGVPSYVPKSFPDVSEILQLVRGAGGISVLAHPGHYTSHRHLLMMLEMGLDGFEVYHPSHDQALQRYYRNLAIELGVVATGGSDFHGSKPADQTNIGKYYTQPTPEGNLFGPRTL